ncbi:hypothetical protein KQX54_013195 [Cotesia glomerata]|uniref:Uncharacterized protein n=1 Tax=Cotesia glomerata TaxID=32391 RepID=A0AAV7IB96_COTGL|nr:hypothetical protein KQX54_013195 [Cotesia glomerata]
MLRILLQISVLFVLLDGFNDICKHLREDYINLEKCVAVVENTTAVSSEVDHDLNSVKLIEDIEVRQLLLET